MYADCYRGRVTGLERDNKIKFNGQVLFRMQRNISKMYSNIALNSSVFLRCHTHNIIKLTRCISRPLLCFICPAVIILPPIQTRYIGTFGAPLIMKLNRAYINRGSCSLYYYYQLRTTNFSAKREYKSENVISTIALNWR